jgi:PAS domain S-box-containing protein
LFLASVYIHKDTCPKLINKSVLMFFSLSLSVISVSFIILYNDYLLTLYDFSRAATSGSYLFMIAAIVSYASYLYARRSKETGESDLIFLIYGIIIIIISNVINLSFEYSANFLLVTGYYFIYFGLYRSSVELPYEKLALVEEKLHRAAEEKYRNLIDNANDAIITTDLENRITGWNKAAEKLFGWTASEASGRMFSSLFVPDNSIILQEKSGQNALNSIISNKMETVRLRKDGTKINVSMTISPILNEDIDRLFKPFQQLDSSYGRKYGGSGLGLAICKRIITYHNGKIWTESEFGKGSSFQFTIPYTHKIKEENVDSILFEEKGEIRYEQNNGNGGTYCRNSI